MFDRSSQVLNRLDRFLRDHVPHDLYLDTAPVEVVGWEAPDEPVSFETARDADYVPIAIGSPWGRPWGTTWFRVRGEVPFFAEIVAVPATAAGEAAIRAALRDDAVIRARFRLVEGT